MPQGQPGDIRIVIGNEDKTGGRHIPALRNRGKVPKTFVDRNNSHDRCRRSSQGFDELIHCPDLYDLALREFARERFGNIGPYERILLVDGNKHRDIHLC